MNEMNRIIDAKSRVTAAMTTVTTSSGTANHPMEPKVKHTRKILGIIAIIALTNERVKIMKIIKNMV